KKIWDGDFKIIEGVNFKTKENNSYWLGRAGCSAAHTKAIFMAYQSGAQNAMIFEDDIFLKNEDYLYRAILDIKNINYDILYLGARIKSQMQDFSNNLYRIYNWGQGHATLYNRKAMKIILDLLPSWD